MEKSCYADEVSFIVNKIEQSAYEIEGNFYSRSGIKISIPQYFLKIVFHSYNLNQDSIKVEEAKIFGYDLIPAYENKITIFHEDMPLKGDKNYIVIDL
jgi:hypothetical protein